MASSTEQRIRMRDEIFLKRVRARMESEGPYVCAVLQALLKKFPLDQLSEHPMSMPQKIGLLAAMYGTEAHYNHLQNTQREVRIELAQDPRFKDIKDLKDPSSLPTDPDGATP